MTIPTPRQQSARTLSQRSRTSSRKCVSALVIAAVALLASPVAGAIKPFGSVSVAANPDANTLVGLSGLGMLTIEGGSDLLNRQGVVGYFDIGFGIVTVDGAGSTWVNSETLVVGGVGHGDVTISNGGLISSNMDTYIGYTRTFSQGFVTVSGTGSTLASGGRLFVGHEAYGGLWVEAGGQVINELDASIGFRADVDCEATVTGAGSQWINKKELFVGEWGRGSLTVSDGGMVSAKAIYTALTDLHGNGTIQSNGAVLDADIVFDSSRGVSQTLSFGSGGRLEIAFDGSDVVGAGHRGVGTLRIADGRVVTGTDGLLGNMVGAKGVATVTGPASKWICSGELFVGRSGSGLLTVEAGGSVESQKGTLAGRYSGATGTAVITGPGSTWKVSETLNVGESGRGDLTVSNGGKVTVGSLRSGANSIIRLHVSNDDMLVFEGTTAAAPLLYSDGKIALYADAFLPAGSYRAISGPGGGILGDPMQTVTIGGFRNETEKTFDVAAAFRLSAGERRTLAPGDRLIYSDGGRQVGVSVGTISQNPQLTALAILEGDLDALRAKLEPEASIVGAWDLNARFGSLSIDWTLVSMPTGLGARDIQVWRLRNGAWSEYDPEMLTYDDNGITSFTVDTWDGYAVTAVVPVPAALPACLGLLALGGGGMLVRRRMVARL